MKKQPIVSIVMGSQSDMAIMSGASEMLRSFEIEHEVAIVSAHRTPELMFEFAMKAQERGIRVIIAGAGGAAHLPGMIASLTILPVIGVPINSRNSLDGWDSMLSILQMPEGVPVATVAVDGAKNAGILAAQMLGISSSAIRSQLQKYKGFLKNKSKSRASASRVVRRP